MGRHVDKIKLHDLEAKKETGTVDITKSKAVKDIDKRLKVVETLIEKVGNLELAVQDLTDKLASLKLNKKAE